MKSLAHLFDKPWSRWLIVYLAAIGIAAHFAAAGAMFKLVRDYQGSPMELVFKATRKLGVDLEAVQEVVDPAPETPADLPSGVLARQTPRILPTIASALPAAQRQAAWQRHEARFADIGFKIESICAPKMLRSAACWAATGNPDAARDAVGQLRQMKPEWPKVLGNYGNAWQMALAFDWLSDSEALSGVDREAIQAKLKESLQRILRLLDGDSASMWHGRASLAAQALIVAVSIGDASEEHRALLARAEMHFLDLVEALEITEAWPEGYNYWINNRAFMVVLSAAAYLNGYTSSPHHGRVVRMLERIGLWHMQLVRPDRRAAPLGDEGPRVDLKDETRRVIDLIVKLTGNRDLVGYSRWLGELHRRTSYYRSYRWWQPLITDPDLQPSWDAGEGLAGLNGVLPKAELFGRGAMNQLYLRSDWGTDATFLTFRSGASFSHHGHYDAGHFTLFKGAPLALNSGTYGNFTAEHRLNYAIRTVAKNSLLIMRPGETVRPNKFFTENVAAGGQRMTLPTGSAIRSPAHWREQLGQGQHLEAGSLLAFRHQPDDYLYLRADLTSAYNTPDHDEGGSGGKAKRVVRDLFYSFGEDLLLLFDQVDTTDADFMPKWLLHTENRPEAASMGAIQGTAQDGILFASGDELEIANGRGRLTVQRLAPSDAKTLVIGGPSHRYYVDVDGDADTRDGRNMNQGEKLTPWFEAGNWRVEIQPNRLGRHSEFLTALLPGLDQSRRDRVRLLQGPDSVRLVKTPGGDLIAWVVEPGGQFELPAGMGGERLIMVGLASGQDVRLIQASTGQRTATAVSGLVDLNLVADEALRIEW